MVLKNLLKKESALIALFVGVSVAGAILEGFGITIFFPLLIDPQTTAMPAMPFPFNKVLDHFWGLSFDEKLKSVAVILLATSLLRTVCLIYNSQLTLKIRERVVKGLKVQITDLLMRLSLGSFNRKKLSDLQLMFESHIDTFIGMMVELFLNIAAGVVTITLLLGFLFLLSWKMTLVCLGLGAGLSAVFILFSHHIQGLGKTFNVTRSAYNKTLLDILNGMKIIRLLNGEKFMLDRFNGETDRYHKAYFRMTAWTNAIGPLFEFAGVVLMAAILLCAAYFLPKQEGFAGQLPVVITFLIILARLIPPLKTLNHARGAIVARIPAWEEMEKFLDQKDKEIFVNGSKQFARLEQGIAFQGVNFQYQQNGRTILQDISFSVSRGEKVGIVGSSGGGKSTIAELLLRFYDPQTGTIVLDGTNLKEFDIQSVRKKVGLVLQDTFLFHDTVKANIAFANVDATFEEIQAAAKRAHAHDFIMQMPQGYDTIVGDRGVLMSGGQRQRLAIARAILSEPEILIFDEATSALDSESEQTVQKALTEVSRGKTVITIAHRLSTVLDSDKIIVLEQGHIVEEGTHESLIKTDGRYQKLAQLQSL